MLLWLSFVVQKVFSTFIVLIPGLKFKFVLGADGAEEREDRVHGQRGGVLPGLPGGDVRSPLAAKQQAQFQRRQTRQKGKARAFCIDFKFFKALVDLDSRSTYWILEPFRK